MRGELAFLPQRAPMLRALELAREAEQAGEVPVGAVVVREGAVLGEGRNRRESAQSALAHAEIEAIHQACQALGTWRLAGCQLYVTLEPCPMCAGAAVNARIQRIIYGADDPAAGCCGTAADVISLPGTHQAELYRGYMEEECRTLLSRFFQSLRAAKTENPTPSTLPPKSSPA